MMFLLQQRSDLASAAQALTHVSSITKPRADLDVFLELMRKTIETVAISTSRGSRSCIFSRSLYSRVPCGYTESSS